MIAAIKDIPLWAVVTDALHHYLDRFERQHGRLPQLEESRDLSTRLKG